MADTPTPRPLTADEKLLHEAALRVDGLHWTGDFNGLESDPELVTALAERVRELRAEVDRLTADIHGCGCPAPYDQCTHEEPLLRQIGRLTSDLAERAAERDAADAVIRRIYWEAYLPELPDLWDPVTDKGDDPADPEPMAPAEAEALRRARAAQPQEPT